MCAICGDKTARYLCQTLTCFQGQFKEYATLNHHNPTHIQRMIFDEE
jgi:hypothetical protein